MSEGHAKLAPSAAHRWMRCAGSVGLCAQVPRLDSEASREGTFAHGVAATVLVKDIDRVATLIGISDGEFTVDQEMATHLQAYVSIVRTEHLLTEGTLQVEQKVILSPELWGTADALLWSPGVLDIYDLKFGRGKFVDVVDNEQEMIYALGALRTFVTFASKFEVRTVRLHIVQPRRPDDEGEIHRTHTVTVTMLEDWWKEKVSRAIDEINRPEPHFFAGEHCQFCDGKPRCPELAKTALASANEVFTEIDPTKERIRPPSIRELTPEQLAFAIENAAIVETWLKSVRDHAVQRARSGDRIPGFKLVASIGNRRWKDPETATQILKNLGVEPWEQKLVSPAQAEKRLGKGGKTALGSLTERPVTGISLVPESDKRPAIAGGEVFDVIP